MRMESLLFPPLNALRADFFERVSEGEKGGKGVIIRTRHFILAGRLFRCGQVMLIEKCFDYYNKVVHRSARHKSCLKSAERSCSKSEGI
jgi:hypothetical protein